MWVPSGEKNSKNLTELFEVDTVSLYVGLKKVVNDNVEKIF